MIRGRPQVDGWFRLETDASAKFIGIVTFDINV